MDTNWRGHWCALRISSLLFAEDPGSEEREFPNQLTKAELKDSAKTQFVITIKIDMIPKQSRCANYKCYLNIANVNLENQFQTKTLNYYKFNKFI
jgi:hypothetical protein